MTTLSGTANFQLTRNELVSAILRGMSVIGIGQTPDPEDFTNVAQALNLLIKTWHTMGVQLWTIEKFTLTPVVDQIEYRLGANSGKVVSATTVAGTTVYTVAPTATFSAPGGGGVTATGTVALNSSSPGGIAITITNAGTKYTSPPTVTLTGGTDGAGVTAFANLDGRFMTRPLRIMHEAFLRHTADGNDTPLTQLDRVSYQRLGLKTSSSQPNQYYYDPQLDDGILSIYPTASSATTYTLRFSHQRPLQDVNLATENVDFPQEWLLPLKWGVIDEIGLEY
ncbi:MAG: hypothetical protein MN733_20770, partial [Nitrososphaera sp.]|nr:hypothetical protein [Nitrososphaera sp.]